MKIMTRIGKAVFDALGVNGEFVPCVHTVGARWKKANTMCRGPATRQVHRPLSETREVWSYVPGMAATPFWQEVFRVGIASSWAARKPKVATSLAGRAHAESWASRPRGQEVAPLAWPFRPQPAAKTNSPCWFRQRASRAGKSPPSARHRLDQDRAPTLQALRDQSGAGYFGVAPGTNTETNPTALPLWTRTLSTPTSR